MDVVCPVCKKSHHETTDQYDPDATVNGSMVRLKQKYRNYGWAVFGDGNTAIPCSIGERASTKYADMECPWCCNLLAPKGKLTIADSPKDVVSKAIDLVSNDPLTCIRCGKKFTNTDRGNAWFKKHLETCNA